jgi:hypothetical protein
MTVIGKRDLECSASAARPSLCVVPIAMTASALCA